MKSHLWLLAFVGALVCGAALPVRTGEVPGKEQIKLPNQWSLDPAGESRVLGMFPMNARLSPDGKFLAVIHCGFGTHEIIVIRTADNAEVSRVDEPNLYYGLVFSADGKRLYASGGDDEVVYEFPFAEGYLQKPRVISVIDSGQDPKKEHRVPCGLALNGDESLLAVCETWGNSVSFVDVASGARRARVQFPNEHRPYDCKFSKDGKTLFVSLWGKGGVALIDPAKPEAEPKIVPAGSHPNEMTLSPDGSRLCVANANNNTVSVMDAATGNTLETLNTAMYPESLEGSTPNSVEFSPEGKRLYIANADNNCVAVFDVSKAGESRSLGLVPVGWYPTSVRVSKDGKTLYVVDAKGLSSFANPEGPNPYMQGKDRRSLHQYSGAILRGALSIIPVPTDEQFEAYTKRVYACSPYRADKQAVAPRPEGNPIPAKIGDASPIKHVIYILKENRTYDHIFGDMPEGNGDPDLCIFPEKFTPNHHALAREFVLLDNFYVESQVSADGHEWSMGAYATDFVQKTWPGNYGGHGLGYPAEGASTTAFPDAGYIWDKCIEAKVPFYNFGEFVDHEGPVGTPGKTNMKSLEGHFDPMYRGWDLSYPDVKRAERFLEQFNKFVTEGTLPPFIVMRLPNDHTSGTKPGMPTPRAMVSDNDFALGTIVEALTKSPVWKETAVFIVEDDAQNGSDHVDAHRTVAMVLSPYTRGRGVDSTFYSTASMLRTMELILGLQPMSQYDAGALPMYNTFRNDADATAYVCRPVPEDWRTRQNGPDAYGAEQSAKLDFDKEDAADDIAFNEIIWKAVRGADSPMPAPVRAAFVHPVDKDEEED
jgi:YVTN family beta-propeller protein